VKKDDTGNLEKEARHVVERDRGGRYLNKKDGSTRANMNGS